MKNKAAHHIVRLVLDDILWEEFNKQGSLIHKLKGEIIELEYKGDPEVIQDILDQNEIDKQALENRITDLEAANSAKDMEIQNLKDRIIVLEPEPEQP